MASAHKNCAGRQINMCSRKPKIERLVNARLPVTGIRQITERDSGGELAIGWIDSWWQTISPKANVRA